MFGIWSLAEYKTVRPWIHNGVDIPSFFQPYKGIFMKRHFDSDIPPQMYFQNAPICHEYKDFISNTISLRLEEGSMLLLGRVGVDPPPRVVNALSIEPIKPRLILSMRAVNEFCRPAPFSLSPLSDIVRHIPAGGFSPVQMMRRDTSTSRLPRSRTTTVASSGVGGGFATRRFLSAGKILPTYIL